METFVFKHPSGVELRIDDETKESAIATLKNLLDDYAKLSESNISKLPCNKLQGFYKNFIVKEDLWSTPCVNLFKKENEGKNGRNYSTGVYVKFLRVLKKISIEADFNTVLMRDLKPFAKNNFIEILSLDYNIGLKTSEYINSEYNRILIENSIYQSPKQKETTAEKMRIEFYGENDARSYYPDEIKLMENYAEEYHKQKLKEENKSFGYQPNIHRPMDF